MSRKTAEVVYGVTSQTVEYRCMQGRPTSATFDVLLDEAGDDDTSEFSGTATVESVTQTLSSASGPSQSDPTRINVTSTNVLTTRRYLISEGSRQEWITPVEVGTGYVIARNPLRNDYTTAATFVGTTLTAAISNTWAADLAHINNQMDPNPGYRVRWEILVNGATVIAYSFFDFVRAPVAHQVDLEDLNDRAPGLIDSLPTEYRIDQGRSLIESAWKSVQARLAAMKIDTDALRDDLVTDELVILRSLNMLARGGWRPLGYDSLAAYIADTQQDYDRFIEQHFLVSQPHMMAVSTTGGAEVVRQFVIGK